MSLTDVRFIDWRGKGRKFLGMPSSKGHGPQSGRSFRRLNRSLGSKGIDFDSTESHKRRPKASTHGENDEDDSDISSHHSGDWTLEEFSVHGKQDVAEMNNIFRYLGLPGPANLGIDNEAYELIKRTPSGSPVDAYTPRNDSPNDFTFHRQYSYGGSSVSPSPQGTPRPSLSPQKSPPPVGQFTRTEPEIVDCTLLVPQIRTPPSSQVKSSTPTIAVRAAASSGSRHERNEGATSRDRPGFRDVVWQAVERHHSKIQDEAAGVENFILSHGDGDFPRHSSLPGRIEDDQSSPSPPLAAAGDRSRSRTASESAPRPPIERAQSEPISVVSFSGPGKTSQNKTSQNSIGGTSLKWKIVDRLDNGVSEKNSTDQDLDGPTTPRIVESWPKVSDRSSGANVSHGQPQIPGASSPTHSFQSKVREVPSANAKSMPMVLKPPPRMSIFKIPQDQISTKDILGSLAPDVAEDAIRSYFSASDDEEKASETDDEENASETDEGQPSVSMSEASSSTAVANPELPQHLTNGDVSAAAAAVANPEQSQQLINGDVSAAAVANPEQPQHLTNGDVSAAAAAADEGNGPGRRNDLTVDVPERILRKVQSVRIGGNLAPDLPPVVGTPVVVEGPKHPWTKGEMLGQGSFGTVYDAVDSVGMWFAVKEVSMVEQDKQAQQAIAQLMQEIELLSQFKHDNVVQYLGTEKAHGKLYIFLELVSKGSLATICKRIKLTHSQIGAYTRQILKGLKYLHDRHIVHRDIKCANILVDTTGTCKLADFGMAKQMNSLDQMKSCKGSAYWMAPEVIDPKKFSGLPADIWSLGCSILEMATGSPPFGDMEWYRVLWTVGHGTAPPIPDTLSETAKDFVKRCLDVNPAKRPTATELLNHPFVRQDLGSTPTSQDAAVNFQASENTLQPICEEQSADFSGTSSQEARSLPNGH